MIEYPALKEQPSSRRVVDAFKGYNHNLQISDGEFFDMENLTSDHYPALSPRKKRRILQDFSAEGGDGVVTGVADLGYKALVYTRGTRICGIGSLDFTVDLGLDDKPKRLVSMGAYLIVWPDQKYINIQNPEEHGSLGHRVEISTGKVNFELCSADGELFGDAVVAATAPKEPKDKALWIDTSASPHTLKRYSETSGTWVSVLSTYVKISGLPDSCTGFGQYDGIRISGVTAAEDLNGWAVIQNKVTSGEIIISGILDEAVTQDCADAAICIERKIPAMDFVIEAGNRLWGCRYGENAEGTIVNEIYASKLGDCKNWNCFTGISTDSWVGSVGSPGEFTGAVNLLGNPVFYKNDIKHKVWISSTGGHQITSTPCQGVAFTCGDSLAVINGAAIYKSNRGFCVDDGSMPVEIGQCFAGAAYTDAVGCVSMNKYFVSMCGSDGAWHLFVYDMDRKLWH